MACYGRFALFPKRLHSCLLCKVLWFTGQFFRLFFIWLLNFCPVSPISRCSYSFCTGYHKYNLFCQQDQLCLWFNKNFPERCMWSHSRGDAMFLENPASSFCESLKVGDKYHAPAFLCSVLLFSFCSDVTGQPSNRKSDEENGSLWRSLLPRMDKTVRLVLKTKEIRFQHLSRTWWICSIIYEITSGTDFINKNHKNHLHSLSIGVGYKFFVLLRA